MIRAYQYQESHSLQNSLKELYFIDVYQSVPAQAWRINIHAEKLHDSDPQLANNFIKLLDTIREYQGLKAAGKWVECFDKHMQAIVCLIKLLE